MTIRSKDQQCQRPDGNRFSLFKPAVRRYRGALHINSVQAALSRMFTKIFERIFIAL
ncbi:hypothetical protein PSYAE_05175 [Pseudomonas amygdali pv. aesculi str. 0893_23]|nr:hypothetical protein PSYAE_05175 [Pseudomonas amygdali pv. aesculi str. 0893_23]